MWRNGAPRYSSAYQASRTEPLTLQLHRRRLAATWGTVPLADSSSDSRHGPRMIILCGLRESSSTT
jgi:hypothetical protein